MRARWAVRSAMPIVVAVATAAAQAPAFRSNVDAVRVDVLVTDGRGNPVPRLEGHQFELRDNGVPQRVASVAYGVMPVHLVLALDTSFSIEGDNLEVLLGAVRVLLEHTRQGDSATVVAFSHGITVAHAVNGETAALDALLRSMRPRGLTSLHDAAWTALLIAGRPGMRSLVVVLSDGMDNRSWLEERAVVHTASRVNATVYAVHVNTREKRGPWPDTSRASTTPVPGSAFLEDLATASGGRALTANIGRDVQPTLVKVLEEFRRRYVLTYVPEGVSASGWHRVDVAVKRNGTRVVARPGYQRDWGGR